MPTQLVDMPATQATPDLTREFVVGKLETFLEDRIKELTNMIRRDREAVASGPSETNMQEKAQARDDASSTLEKNKKKLEEFSDTLAWLKRVNVCSNEPCSSGCFWHFDENGEKILYLLYSPKDLPLGNEMTIYLDTAAITSQLNVDTFSLLNIQCDFFARLMEDQIVRPGAEFSGGFEGNKKAVFTLLNVF